MDLATNPRRTEPLTGEIKLINGHKAMCVSPHASYGGGSGPLWAIQGGFASFTVEGGHGYLSGKCRKLLPRHKALVIEILDGDAWGRYATGERVVIPCRAIGRYDNKSVRQTDLDRKVDDQNQAIRNRMAFESISLREIEPLLRHRYRQEIGHLLGEETTQLLEALIQEYMTFCAGMTKSNGQAIHGTSKKMKRSKRRIEALLAKGLKSETLKADSRHHALSAATLARHGVGQISNGIL